MRAVLSLAELRERLSDADGLRGREVFEAPGVRGGLPKGGLIELVGSSRTEWVAQFLALHVAAACAWIEDLFTVHPTGLEQRGAELSRILFVQTHQDLHWAALQILRSQLFQFLVMPGDVREDRFLRRLQLAAEKSNAGVFLLSERPSSSWTLSAQLRVSHGREPEILKRRG